MNEGKASVKSDLILPAIVFLILNPLSYFSISNKSFVVSKYFIEPSAGLNEDGLEIFVKKIVSKEPSGIFSSAPKA